MQATHHNHINNQALPSLSGRSLAVLDPSDGQVFAHIPRSDERDIDAAVRAARQAFDGGWQDTPALERGRLLMKLSQAVLAHQDGLAALEQRDCGKPTQIGRAHV